MYVTWTVFQNQPDQRFCDYHLIQARNVRMDELPMVMDLSCEVRILLLGRLEDNLITVSACAQPLLFPAHLRPICEVVSCEVDLAE